MWSIRSRVVAILCADLHLSLRPPAARSTEPCWLSAMDHILSQIRSLAEAHSAPVLCAGDVFDSWKAEPELINWAIDHLPRMYAVAGNHDLPYHREDLTYRSAYGTLARAGVIVPLPPGPTVVTPLVLYGRPLGGEVPRATPTALTSVLLTHEYLHTPGTGHRMASPDSLLVRSSDRFEGFDCVIVGDNHVPFQLRLHNGCRVFNCGSPILRRADDRHTPRVGLLHASGRISSHPLECVQPRPIDEDTPESAPACDQFVEGLVTLSGGPRLDYRECLIRTMEAQQVSPQVRKILLEALGHGQ